MGNGVRHYGGGGIPGNSFTDAIMGHLRGNAPSGQQPAMAHSWQDIMAAGRNRMGAGVNGYGAAGGHLPGAPYNAPAGNIYRPFGTPPPFVNDPTISTPTSQPSLQTGARMSGPLRPSVGGPGGEMVAPLPGALGGVTAKGLARGGALRARRKKGR